MRVEIKLPDDKKFNNDLKALAKTKNRSRKNFIETLVIEAVKGLNTGEVDKNGVEIMYGTSKLKFPDGSFGKLLFDYGQLAAYYARENNTCIIDLEGVNNSNSIYLRDCEVV